MSYKYYTKKYYSTVCHIFEFDPKEFRLDVSLGIKGKLETLPKISGEPKKNEKVIAKMNASFFGMDGKSGDTYSTFVDEGVIHKGSAAHYPTLIFWKDYTMSFEHNPNNERLAYYQKNAFFALGVGWTLVIDGKANYTYDKKTLVNVFGHPYQRAPRTMIGQKADGTIVMVATNGRLTGSAGLTTVHMSDIMLKLGCIIAANMDGGGSSEMYIGDKTVNKLQGNAHRKIGTAFIVYGPKENNQIVIKVPDNKYSSNKSAITTTTVNVRTGPGTTYSKLGSVNKSTTITILGENSTGKWYYFKNSNFTEGWISSAYVKINTTVNSKVTKKATSNLRIRDSRSTKGNILGIIPKGVSVEVSELQSGWYKVKYNKITGYASADYLK